MQDFVRFSGPSQGPRSVLRNRHGDGTGTRILLVAGLRTDELFGTHALGVFHQDLAKGDAGVGRIEGTLDLYPVSCPDGVDGLARGDWTRGAEAQVLEALVRDAEGATLCVHLVASEPGLPEMPQLHVSAAGLERLAPILGRANVDLVQVRQSFAPGTLAARMEAAGVPAVELRLGGGWPDAETERQLLRGLAGLCDGLGALALERSPAGPPPRVVSDKDVRAVTAPCGGLFVARPRDEWDEVWEGDALGRIVDPRDGRVLAEVAAPDQGMLVALRSNAFVARGAVLARVASAPEET